MHSRACVLLNVLNLDGACREMIEDLQVRFNESEELEFSTILGASYYHEEEVCWEACDSMLGIGGYP